MIENELKNSSKAVQEVMVSDSRIKNIISEIINDYNKNNILNTEDVIVISCVIYKTIKSQLDAGIISGIDNVASSIGEMLVLLSDEIYRDKLNYMSLEDIKNYLNNIGVRNFKFLLNSQINEIIDLYYNRQKHVEFSTKYFDSLMYKIPKYMSNAIAMTKLRKVHYEIMIPIIRYYKQKFENIKDSNLEILNAINGKYPGKVINFAIKDIPTQTIVNDIVLKRIDIDYSQVDNLTEIVELVTKI